jgi:hypothetical protein
VPAAPKNPARQTNYKAISWRQTIPAKLPSGNQFETFADFNCGSGPENGHETAVESVF